jgi:hypothetical protein
MYVPDSILGADLTGAELYLYLALWLKSPDKGECHCSHAELAELTGKSVDHTRRIMRSLVNKGFVKHEAWARYVVVLEPPAPASEKGGAL